LPIIANPNGNSAVPVPVTTLIDAGTAVR